MIEALTDAAFDTLKLVPFLLITYLFMEYLEHKAGERAGELLRRAGKAGPFWGAAAGLLPQCGFSAAAANFYAARLISRGTLAAVFLATSDEMLPVLLSRPAGVRMIAPLLLLKFAVGMTAGFAVDFAGRRLRRETVPGEPQIHKLCKQEHCDCEAGIVPSALRHTGSIAGFLLLVSFLLNLAIARLGEESLAAFMQGRPAVSVLLAGLVGLIPNCAPSVLLTELYLQGTIRLGAAMAGLLAGAGSGLLILFRMNRERKDNLKIVGIVYGVGVTAGLLWELL